MTAIQPRIIRPYEGPKNPTCSICLETDEEDYVQTTCCTNFLGTEIIRKTYHKDCFANWARNIQFSQKDTFPCPFFSVHKIDKSEILPSNYPLALDFIEAAKNGDIERIREILRNPNEVPMEVEGRLIEALMGAIEGNFLNIVRAIRLFPRSDQIMVAGGIFNDGLTDCLNAAASNNNLDIVRELLLFHQAYQIPAEGTFSFAGTLSWGVENNNLEMVKEILNHLNANQISRASLAMILIRAYQMGYSEVAHEIENYPNTPKLILSDSLKTYYYMMINRVSKTIKENTILTTAIATGIDRCFRVLFILETARINGMVAKSLEVNPFIFF